MKNLHEYINQLRQYETEWWIDNPGKHPVVFAKELALGVLTEIKKDGLTEIYVHPASFAGVVEYAYVICYLEESGILVKKLER